MVPKKGTTVRWPSAMGHEECRRCLSQALHEQLGEGTSAAKTIMRWTGVSNRAARYWLAGERCPSGCELILLARHSDCVLQAILELAGRPSLKLGLDLHAVRQALERASRALDGVE
ncbi:hypothetical protein [Rhizobium sp. BE258]|uniref:hypothetical protein n=1 Tax=Rhizobium sp. BE258 TaxID=2817722 RepID=UPI00285E58FA|nr:hypothetical protein [Rhizobium sp. BE258]MDR7145159.1 hypothetical protein [Rhizobium sp. BE258]